MKRAFIGVLLSVAIAPGLRAEQFVEAAGFRVHYAAMHTMDLAPEVARSFGVRRNPARALLMLNAQRVEASGVAPVPAAGTGHARNLVGQTERLRLRPVREGEWHYLLAEFQILNQEFIRFDVQVTPQGAAAPLTVRFEQQFFTD